jgi:predicted nucleic acid-binding protein
MKFWDTSAITPLLVEEADSDRREGQLEGDSTMIVWYGTPAEIQSALSRRRREGMLTAEAERLAMARWAALAASWAEVEPLRRVRDRALRLLRVHPLRAADALQLAAALVACSEQTTAFEFLTANFRLQEAALAEGFMSD